MVDVQVVLIVDSADAVEMLGGHDGGLVVAVDGLLSGGEGGVFEEVLSVDEPGLLVQLEYFHVIELQKTVNCPRGKTIS